jgi:hypothetical protein
MSDIINKICTTHRTNRSGDKLKKNYQQAEIIVDNTTMEYKCGDM